MNRIALRTAWDTKGSRADFNLSIVCNASSGMITRHRFCFTNSCTERSEYTKTLASTILTP